LVGYSPTFVNAAREVGLEGLLDETFSLGRWVRRRRKALDLTQADLAGQVGCSAEFLRKIEADARRPSKEVAARLARHLLLAPDECEAFVRAARAEVAPDYLSDPMNSVPRPEFVYQSGMRTDQPIHNLPALINPLIGREVVITSLARLLQGGARLITITGTGGVGKTRLALEFAAWLAAAMPDSYPNGLWLANLATLVDSTQVAPAIARVVGAPEQANLSIEDSLKTFLGTRQTLLVLDNFEHLMDAALFVEELLYSAPGLVVLVTSRSPLDLQGEQIWALDPLSEDAAVALFTARVRQKRAKLTLAPADRDLIATIARRLDNLPLAIELAAARVKLFTPRELLARLNAEGSLPVLVGGATSLPSRQRTMQATLEWSYALLSEAEQALLGRLAIFAGSFGLLAAEKVCGFGSMTAELLIGLVDQSLVQQADSHADMTRFSLLATVHEFARELLAASGVEHVARRQHAIYVLELVEAAELHLLGPQQGDWRDRLKAENDDIIAALTWCLTADGDSTIGLQIAGALLWYWKPLGYRREGLAWLDAILARCEDAEPRAKAKALHSAGTLAGRSGKYTEAAAHLKEALNICRTFEDTHGMLINLSQLSVFACEQGDYVYATTLCRQSLELAQQQQDTEAVAQALGALGAISRAQGDYAQALHWYRQALVSAQQIGDAQSTGWSLANIGRSVLAQGDIAQAADLFEQSRTLFEGAALADSLAWMEHEFGCVALAQGEDRHAEERFTAALAQAQAIWLPLLIAYALEGLAEVRRTSHPQHAARLFGAASKIRYEVANPLTPAEQRRHTPIIAHLRTILGNDTFAAAWQAGEALVWDNVAGEAAALPAVSAHSAQA
jgi:predicted ATPase/transcriptional regulator with XRE-family HTH domain/Tfp pilus assembly protein PilF